MNIFLRLYYAIVGEPSFKKAVTDIEKAMSKLDKAVLHQTDKSDLLHKLAEDAAKAKEIAIAEAEKARRVASKFAELLA